MCLGPEQHVVLDRARGNTSLATPVHLWGLLLMIPLKRTPGPESEETPWRRNVDEISYVQIPRIQEPFAVAELTR